MPTRIGLLFEFPTLNGGERSMLSLLDHWRSSAELEFVAFAPSAGRLAEDLQRRQVTLVPFHRQAQPPQTAPESAAELLRLCDQYRLDVLHANSLSMARLAGRMRTRIRTLAGSPATQRLCVTGHLRDMIRLSRTAVDELNENDFTVAVSQAVRDFHTQQGLCGARCRVIYNGISDARYAPQDRVEARRTALPGMAPAATVILNVGQISLRKSQADAAAAMIALQRSDPQRDLHLVVAGERYSMKPESIACEQALHQMFADAGMPQRLHLLGYRDDVPRLMNAASLLVHSARQEPFGRVLLEAAACGLPIIATNVGGTREMLRNGTDALLVPPASADAIEAAIRSFLDDQEGPSRYAQSARARVAEQFTVAAAAGQLAHLWLECTTDREL